MLTSASYVHTIHNNSSTATIASPDSETCLIRSIAALSISPPLQNITTASPSPKQINLDDDVVDDVVVESVDGKELIEGKKEEEREMHISMM